MRQQGTNPQFLEDIKAPARHIIVRLWWINKDIVISSKNYLQSIKIDNTPTMGKPWGYTVSSYADIQILQNDYNIEVGDKVLVNFNTDDGYCQYIAYTIDSIDTDQKTGTKTLHCYDLIYQYSKHTWKEVNITFPATIRDLTRAVREASGMTDPSFTPIPSGKAWLNSDIIIDSINVTDDTCLRDIMDDICEVTGVVWTFNSVQSIGLLPLDFATFIDRLPSTSDITIEKQDYFEAETSTDICEVTGVAYVNAMGDGVMVGDDSGYVMVCPDNCILDNMSDDDVRTVLNVLLNQGPNIIRPYSLDWRANPALQIGDIITIEDKDGNDYQTVYMGGSLTYDGGLREQSSWQSQQSDTDMIPLAPTATLGDAIRTTSAKIDKQNQTIELVVSEIGTAKSPYATLKMRLDSIEQTVGEGNITFAQPDTPTGIAPRYIVAGDLWFDTDDQKWYRYNGTTWVLVEDGDIADAVERVSHIEQTVEGITSTVAEHTTHLGTIDSGMQTQQSQIQQLSTAITSKVERIDFDDALNTIDAHMSEIRQTADSVETEVSNARNEYSTLKQRIDAIDVTVAGGNKTYRQATQPVGEVKSGDLWFDTTNNVLKRYDGTTWVVLKDGDIAQLTTAVSTLQVNLDGIQGTVSSHTQHLSTIDGNITSIDTALSTVRQTANAVSVEVGNACDQGSTLKQTLDAIRATVAGGNKTFRQATAPITDLIAGDLWFDTTNNVLKRYDGTTWIILKDGDIAQLTTAVSTLTVDLDGIQGTVSSHTQHLSTIDGNITSVQTALSTVKQTADAVSVEVGNACDQGSTLKQTLDAIRATVAGGNKTFRQATAPITDLIAGDLWFNTTDEHWYRYDGSQWVLVQDGDVATAISQSSEAIQTAQGFSQRVTQVEQDVNTVEGRVSTAESEITQLATAITLRVEKDGVISSINQTPEEIKIESDKINLSGYVTFTGDGDGQSVINGDTIITNDLTVTGNFKANGIDLRHIYAEDVHIDSTLDLFGATVSASRVTTPTTITYSPATQNVTPVGDDHLRISLTRHTGTTVMPVSDSLSATVVVKRYGYAGQQTVTVPISMQQGTTGGGGTVVIPFTTPSAAYIDSVTYSRDYLNYYALDYINIQKPIKVTSIKSPLKVQEIQAENAFNHSTITYTDIMPQPRSNPAYPPSQIGSSSQQWDNIWGKTIHADTIGTSSTECPQTIYAENIETDNIDTDFAYINQLTGNGITIGNVNGIHIVITSSGITEYNGITITRTKTWSQLLS